MTPHAVALALLCCTTAVADASAADHRVVIDAMAFTPKVVAVRPGDTITWVNKDMFAHNVTAASRGISSGDLQPGQSWRHTVRQGEDFDYLCTLHPTMTGKVEIGTKTAPKAAIKPARPRSTS